MAGIYFHIPFCKQACHYCNFYFTTSTRFLDSTVPALIQELDLRQSYLNDKIDTIYFGGGTPSMLTALQLQALIDEVYKRYTVDSDVEITLEANPDNLNYDYLYALKDTEINRLSIGIQSFYDEELQWMNRAHKGAEAHQCLEDCKRLHFDNLNVDLIYGIPISDAERWQSNMEQALQYEPAHFSCYALTVEPRTALAHHIKKGKSPAVRDRAVEEQFYMTHDVLKSHGYEHYEISNYALPGQASKHNSAYWEGAHYLGIGPGAHSFDGRSRSWNIEHLPKYLKAIDARQPLLETEYLSDDDRYNEWVMTSIRLQEGISKQSIYDRFPNHWVHFLHALTEIPQDYIEEDKYTIRLSRAGLMFADFVGSMLFKLS